jgi:glycosyltransferase involved in cell wall biosynthesis
VVVDGGSQDGTREAAVRRGARVVPQQERGYGGGAASRLRRHRSPLHRHHGCGPVAPTGVPG